MIYHMYSDDELIILARNGDEMAEEILAKRYGKLVRICARQFFLVGGDGEDLIQEGMLGLLNAIRRYDPVGDASFKTYAERCIRNRLLTAVESANRMKNDPLNRGVPLDVWQREDDGMTHSDQFSVRCPEDIILEREQATEIRAEYRKRLSKFESEVLERYLDGLSYREIAVSMGKTEKSIDNAVQRIRKKFAKE